jgi:uncharacterized protein (DUF362 family)
MVSTIAIKKNPQDPFTDAVEEILDAINYLPAKEKILLKPNIVVAATPEEGATTHPKVTEALVQYFRKRKKEVVIAEGTGIFGTNLEFERLLRATHYDRIRDRLGVPIINLEQVETEKIPWRFGRIRLPKVLKDYEYVNVPTMKTHLQTQVSLGVKNQKGLLPMESKKLFHKKNLHAHILELTNVIQPSLTVMDALYCIEGTGPTGPPVGEVKKLNTLLAGKGLMALDNVCVQIMGFDIHEIAHLRPVRDIEVVGEKIEAVKAPFKKPSSAFRLDRFEALMDERACTMCTVSLYKALSKILNTPELHMELEKRKDLNRIRVILGPGDPPSDLGTRALCIGDCAASPARKAHLPLIIGCHPDFREIVNFFFPKYYS